MGTPADKVIVLVGQDTSISNMAALLDAHWLIEGYQRDDAAPGTLYEARWNIPTERMKMRTPHIVPLAKQTPAILSQLHGLTDGEYLFPGERSDERTMCNNRSSRALSACGPEPNDWSRVFVVWRLRS
jgi:hypothetical protein